MPYPALSAHRGAVGATEDGGVPIDADLVGETQSGAVDELEPMSLQGSAHFLSVHDVAPLSGTLAAIRPDALPGTARLPDSRVKLVAKAPCSVPERDER